MNWVIARPGRELMGIRYLLIVEHIRSLLDFIQVPGFPSAIETRSLPTLTRSYPRRFAFDVAWPAAPFARLTHSRRHVFNASRGL